MGVGGYCLTKDPWFVNHLGESLGLELAIPRTSRTVNDTMPTYTYGLLTQLLADQGKTIETSKIAVLGIAFKNNTGDCRLTPTKYVVELLEESGCQLSVHDPWVPDEEAHTVTERPADPGHRVRGQGCRRLGGPCGASGIPPDSAGPAGGPDGSGVRVPRRTQQLRPGGGARRRLRLQGHRPVDGRPINVNRIRETEE